MNIHKLKETENNDLLLKIEKLYFNNKLPLFNGIIAKEKYIKIDITENKITSVIEKKFDKDISLLEEDCSDIDILNKIEHKNFVIYCGEGSYGGEGFIAIMDNNNIVWIMFHENINPIEKIEIGVNKIIGVNNCNIRYEFNINWNEIK